MPRGQFVSGGGKKPGEPKSNTLPDWSEFDGIADDPTHAPIEKQTVTPVLEDPFASVESPPEIPIEEYQAPTSPSLLVEESATPSSYEPSLAMTQPAFEANEFEAPASEQPEQIVEPAPIPSTPLQEIRAYSESRRPGKLAVPASYPYTILIEGYLEPHSREILLDLIGSENLGIREVDLEPGLESGRVLIPRISEYAAIIIVQRLRDSSVKIKIEPSDATSESTDLIDSPFEFEARNFSPKQEGHPAEKMPVTTQSAISGLKQNSVVDTFVSHARFSHEVDTSEIESLIREMKYKAHRKGVKALIELKVQIEPELSTSQNRVTITAVGIS